MKILYLLIPVGVLFLGAAIGLFIWAVKSGQYEDLEGPAHRILMDDDDPRIPRKEHDRQGDVKQEDAESVVKKDQDA